MQTFQGFLDEGFDSPYLPSQLGVKVVSCAEGRAHMLLPFRANHLQNFGVLQGGIAATLIDITLAWAVLSRIHPAQGPTIDLSISYLRPVTSEDLECRALVLRAGRSVAYARAEVTTTSGVLVAAGSGNFLVRPPVPKPPGSVL